jgi:MerR family transcriptional regulator, light-induced transcriptional regulator
MHPLFNEFASYLDRAEKDKCVRMVLSQLESRTLDIVTLYNEILTPALNNKTCREDQTEICIWEEHLKTSIIRTIIECCYPYIVQARDRQFSPAEKGKVVVLCPPGELHEIGARMVADFFTLNGYRTVFIGANTPQEDIINAIKYTRPRYVGISVTNYYNLMAADDVIKKICDLKTAFPLQVIVGGRACKVNPQTCRQSGADMVLETFADIQALS